MNDVRQADNEQGQVPLPQKKHTAKQTNGAGFLVTLMAMLGFLFGSYAVYKDMFAPSSAKGIYVVDGARLAYSYIADAEAKKNDLLNGADADYQSRLQQIETELEQNLAKIQTKITEMSGTGMVVIQRNSVLAYPKQSDITAKIAAELGIPLLPEQPASVMPAATAPVPNKLPETVEKNELPGEGAELD